MDKETLSNFGWVIVTVIVIAVMVAFATPFADYIADSVSKLISTFTTKANNALTSANSRTYSFTTVQGLA